MKRVRERKNRNPYKRKEMREKTRREMSVSLTGATVIFTLYQCCADLCCREQSDSGHMTWLASKAHLAWSINLELTLESLFMYGAGANGRAVIMTPRRNLRAIFWLPMKRTDSRACGSQRRWNFCCRLQVENGKRSRNYKNTPLISCEKIGATSVE